MTKYRWNGRTARSVVLRFALADAQLSTRDGEALLPKHRKACVLCDWLADRYEIDVNSSEFNAAMETAVERAWTPGQLINSCLDKASRRLHPAMTTASSLYKFKKNV